MRFCSEALRTRPEILEGDAQIAAAQRGIQYARRSSLPSLNLSLSDTYTPNAAGFTRRNVGAVSWASASPFSMAAWRGSVSGKRGALPRERK